MSDDPGHRLDAIGASVATTGYTQIELTTSGPVRRLTLNRPHRHNALTSVMLSELTQAGTALGSDPDVRCLVIGGAGPSFSSGMDLTESASGGLIARIATIAESDMQAAIAIIAEAQQAFWWIREVDFPVVASVHGAAMGAGFELALACDIRIVATDARLELTEARHGVLPDLGSTAVLPQLVGYERALDLILTGRQLTGTQAHAMGLASRCVPEDELVEAVAAYADIVAALPREVSGVAKRAARATAETDSLSLAAAGAAAAFRLRYA